MRSTQVPIYLRPRAVAAPSHAAIFTENFGGGAGNLTGKTTTTGSLTWVQVGVGSTFLVQLDGSNHATRNASGISFAAVNAGAQTSFVVSAVINSNVQQQGILMRNDVGFDNYIACGFNGFGTLFLSAHDNTGNIGTAYTQTGYTNDGSTAYTVEVTCDTLNNYSVKVNGSAVPALSGNITNYASNTYFGLFFYAGTGGTVDTMSMTT